MAALAVGSLLPFAVVIAAMKSAGVFDQFWLWTVTYGRQYATAISFATGLEELRYNGAGYLSVFPILWALAMLGATSLVWNQQATHGVSLYSAFSRFRFWPSVQGSTSGRIILSSCCPPWLSWPLWGAPRLCRIGGRRAATPVPSRALLALLAVATVAISVSVVSQRAFLFQDTPYRSLDLFIDITRFQKRWKSLAIFTNSAETSPIMVLGSEPEIYFYTGRRAASPHINYPLMENQPFALAMQHEMAEA